MHDVWTLRGLGQDPNDRPLIDREITPSQLPDAITVAITVAITDMIDGAIEGKVVITDWA